MKNIFKKTAGVMLACSMICAIMTTGCGTESSATAEKATENITANATAVKLEQQTLVDEITGVQVSGMLPAGAKLLTTVDFISSSDHCDSIDVPFTIEGDYPEFKGSIGDYQAYQTDRKTENIPKTINQKGWAEWEGMSGGMLYAEVYFVKDSEVVKCESDFTVTLPFNYRRGLANGGVTDEIVVVEYDYDNKKFIDVELVPEESTQKGMFQFKANKAGIFFLGGKSRVDSFMGFYGTIIN